MPNRCVLCMLSVSPRRKIRAFQVLGGLWPRNRKGGLSFLKGTGQKPFTTMENKNLQKSQWGLVFKKQIFITSKVQEGVLDFWSKEEPR